MVHTHTQHRIRKSIYLYIIYIFGARGCAYVSGGRNRRTQTTKNVNHNPLKIQVCFFIIIIKKKVNQIYGFQGEIKAKYDLRLFNLFTEGFLTIFFHFIHCFFFFGLLSLSLSLSVHVVCKFLLGGFFYLIFSISFSLSLSLSPLFFF